MRLQVRTRELRLREPLPTAWGRLERRPLLLLRLKADDGLIGLGEAAPLEPYDGVPIAAVAEQLEACRPVLAEADGAEQVQVLAACREQGGGPHALAAIDLALWDLAGRRAGRPVSNLLAPGAGDEVAVNATIGAVERRRAAAQARAAAAAGFRCVKVKVGTTGDTARVAAVRSAAGPEVAIRLDANGAWTVEQAVENLRALAAEGIELCEEPVHGVEALRALRRSLAGAVAIAMDETAAEPGAVGSGATDAACLKIGSCGGITGLLEAAAAARAAGSDVYVASSFDGPVGVAAALHAAASLGVTRPCGLATLGVFADCPDPFTLRRGAIAVPSAPGLGVR